MNNQIINLLMTQQNSPLKHRPIAMSMGKLQKAASEGRFRIKSLRTKTLQNDGQHGKVDKDYETDLCSKGFSKEFLKKLYFLKSEQAQLKTSEMKYHSFVKALSKRLQNTRILNVSSLGFQQKSAQLFLSQFIKKNHGFNVYDFSNCTYLNHPQFNNWIMVKCLEKDMRFNKLVAKNLSINPDEMQALLKKVLQIQRIYQLDLSNQNSQTMNRFGENIDFLQDFAKKNSTISILKLENLSLRKQGVQAIQKGISLNSFNPIKILCLKNNAINEHSSLYVNLLSRGGLVTLDISENPLGPNFYLTSPSWKQSTVRNLDVSQTNMNSEALIYFLSRLEENKSLQIFKADKNDFSHHWFNSMKQILVSNTSIESLSLMDCKIFRFSEMFAGLYFNKYLKKLNISFNQYSEGIKQLCELVKNNKTLIELKMKFCGMKTADCSSLFKALANNQYIKFLDISENHLGEEGGNSLMKALNSNNVINNLICEKVQIPVRLKKAIEEKVNDNRLVKNKRQFSLLRNENEQVKRTDIYSWDDVETEEQKVKQNDQKINQLEKKINQVEKDFDRKRFKLYDFIKEWQKQEKKYENEVASLQKQQKEIIKKGQKMGEELDKKIKRTNEDIQKERELIEKIQLIIREQSIKNKKRQNELEDFYQNSKYLNKKKQTKQNKLTFDGSTSLVSKRKKSDRLN